MKLRVMTPTRVVLEQDVAHVTAEDATGSLGLSDHVLPHQHRAVGPGW